MPQDFTFEEALEELRKVATRLGGSVNQLHHIANILERERYSEAKPIK